MLRKTRKDKLLEKRNNIAEECLVSREEELSESEVDSIKQHDDSLDSMDECESSGTDEKKNILNRHRGQKRTRLSVSKVNVT